MRVLAALFLAALPVKSRATSVDPDLHQVQDKSFWFGWAHDYLCNDVMCIYCDVDGATARYTLRSTGSQKMGWMAIGFGRNMADSPMVVVWPTRDESGAFDVTLSQRKAPYETMPKPDPNPPFIAELALSHTGAPPDGIQNIIWAYSRMSPRSADENADISIHHKIGRAKFNLTRTDSAPPKQDPFWTDTPEPHKESDEKVKDMRKVERERPRSFASTVHGALCMIGFLIVIPSGVLVVQYAKMTGNSKALQLHRLLQFGFAGGLIAGGTLAYVFMDSDGSDVAMAHKAGSANLLLLYLVKCAFGSWVYSIPLWRRTRVHSMLLAGLGAMIILLAFYQTWLGLVAAGRHTVEWLAPLITLLTLYVFAVMTVKRLFGSVE
ncbi:hypothetical protein EI94DRAFT_1725760 [Lactarius quietus]|nr:hypothetical protein EI94DRAFT_1725760 [Lactarius quietus]